MIIFFVILSLQSNTVYSVTTTAVYKREVPIVPAPFVDRTTAHQRFVCSVAAIEAQYKGFDINKETGECFPILYSDITQIQPEHNYTKSLKTTNIFNFHPQMSLYANGGGDRSFYLSEIPGGVVTGLTIDVTFQPVDPWVWIIFALCDDTLQTRTLHIAIRKDTEIVKFTHQDSGAYGGSESANPSEGFNYANNDVYKLTIVVTDTHYQIQNNDTPFHDFTHRIDKTRATHLYVYVVNGSFATLYKVAFHTPGS